MVKQGSNELCANIGRSAGNDEYKRHIESLMVYKTHDGFHQSPIQPQLHIGMIATPSINHALNDATPSFQQAVCYYSVDTYIEFEAIDDQSYFTINTSIPKFNDLLLISNTTYDIDTNHFGMPGYPSFILTIPPLFCLKY